MPRTYAVGSLRGLDAIFARFPHAGMLWCRARRGARSLGAAPVMTVEQAHAWITLWRDLHGVAVSDFTLGEYLPGRHLRRAERLAQGHAAARASHGDTGVFRGGEQPRRRFLARQSRKNGRGGRGAQDRARRSARARAAADRCLRRGIERNGGRRAGDNGNKQRTFSGRHCSAGGESGRTIWWRFSPRLPSVSPEPAAEPLGSAKEYYLVRDIDAEPGVYSEAELLAGIRRV